MQITQILSFYPPQNVGFKILRVLVRTTLSCLCSSPHPKSQILATWVFFPGHSKLIPTADYLPTQFLLSGIFHPTTTHISTIAPSLALSHPFSFSITSQAFQDPSPSVWSIFIYLQYTTILQGFFFFFLHVGCVFRFFIFYFFLVFFGIYAFIVCLTHQTSKQFQSRDCMCLLYQTTWFQILLLSCPKCMTLGPRFLFYEKNNNHSTYLLGLCKDKMNSQKRTWRRVNCFKPLSWLLLHLSLLLLSPSPWRSFWHIVATQ